ncbi:Putative LOC100877025 [Caligus rogercresseyi]|uniref:LOC100877025 n=2 Tax=Caligus rogercresseyi TaxID=217165 RepID=A0A7T8GVQ2_CALRO|nr:Putative LOC100877025 [Caligus rogercresseyi]
MGCMASKRDINDIHPNIFHVLNVDDDGVRHSQGQLEVAEAHLVLYQKGKEPVRWPLKCLRRYGFETNMFSFESGRRCKTGAGIYAFRCNRAEQLFNLLQSRVRNYHMTLNSNIVLRGRQDRPSSDSSARPEGAIPAPQPPLRRGSSSSTEDISGGPVYVNWKNGSPSVSYENPLNFAIPQNNVLIHQEPSFEQLNEREYANIEANHQGEEPSVNYIVLDLDQSGPPMI